MTDQIKNINRKRLCRINSPLKLPRLTVEIHFLKIQQVFFFIWGRNFYVKPVAITEKFLCEVAATSREKRYALETTSEQKKEWELLQNRRDICRGWETYRTFSEPAVMNTFFY